MMLNVLGLLGALWMAAPCETGFCKGAGPGDVPSSVQSSQAVFAGLVVAMGDTTLQTPNGSLWLRAVTLRVDHVWKGGEAETVVVLTGHGGADCGFLFERGESYLVYADRGVGESLYAGICGRTAELSRAAADIRELGGPLRRWSN
jgi:hypothetical protein